MYEKEMEEEKLKDPMERQTEALQKQIEEASTHPALTPQKNRPKRPSATTAPCSACACT